MESLTVNDNTDAKIKPTVDRAAIGKMESEKLLKWIKQVQESSRGFLALTKSDLVNFLIREHKVELAPKELSQIRHDNYDPIRHINWITQELKAALAKNDLVRVATLQNEIKGIELSVIAKANGESNVAADGTFSQVQIKPKRKRIKKTDDAVSTATALSIDDLEKDLSEG